MVDVIDQQKQKFFFDSKMIKEYWPLTLGLISAFIYFVGYMRLDIFLSVLGIDVTPIDLFDSKVMFFVGVYVISRAVTLPVVILLILWAVRSKSIESFFLTIVFIYVLIRFMNAGFFPAPLMENYSFGKMTMFFVGLIYAILFFYFSFHLKNKNLIIVGFLLWMMPFLLSVDEARLQLDEKISAEEMPYPGVNGLMKVKVKLPEFTKTKDGYYEAYGYYLTKRDGIVFFVPNFNKAKDDPLRAKLIYVPEGIISSFYTSHVIDGYLYQEIGGKGFWSAFKHEEPIASPTPNFNK